MSSEIKRAEHGVLAVIDRDFTGPMADFQDPKQEWRRLFSELYGTFFLVLVAAGGGMMGAGVPGHDQPDGGCGRAGVDGDGDHHVHGQGVGRAPEPGGQLRLLVARRLPRRRVPGYVVVQLVGASLAALFVHEVVKVSAKYGSNYPAPAIRAGRRS